MAAVLYVGTVDGLAMYQPDADGTWERIGHALAGTLVRAITVVTTRLILVDAGGAAQQSVDGGATWSLSSAEPPKPIGLRVATIQGPAPLANPRLAGATAYARFSGKSAALLGAGAGGMMLFHSRDNGIHWTPADMGGPAGNITTIIPARDKARAAWAGSDNGILLRSVDGGKTWRPVAQEPAPIVCLAAAPTSS